MWDNAGLILCVGLCRMGHGGGAGDHLICAAFSWSASKVQTGLFFWAE